MKKYLLLSFLFLLLSFHFSLVSFAQSSQTDSNSPNVKVLSLSEVVTLAKEQSPAAKQAHSQFTIKYWSYRNYKANYRPQLSIAGSFPDYNKSIKNYTNPNGQDEYINTNIAHSNLSLSLTQNVGLTGGTLGIGSSLDQTINYVGANRFGYLAQPANISYSQPLFRYNGFKWDNKIEPLKYEESKRQLNEDLETVAGQSSVLFFNLLLAQINFEIAQKNLASNDTLYNISKGRYNLGKIAENELLQVELSVMISRNAVSQGKIDVEIGTLKLKNFLKLNDKDSIVLIEPNYIPEFNVEVEQAMKEAKKNRQQIISFERQRLEVESAVARAKKENGFNASIQTYYGLTKSTSLVEDIYGRQFPQQGLHFSFSMPILDWGKAQSQIRTAEENRNIMEMTVTQAEQNFEQEIIILVTQFKMYREKLQVAIKSDTIAMKRYDITMKRYMIGKVGILDMNLALQEQIQAKHGYVQALSDFWTAYFEVRKKTLYDFEQNLQIKY